MISDHDALVELTAERAAVATLEATCLCRSGSAPGSRTGCRARGSRASGRLRVASDRVEGDPEQPAAAGALLAERLLAAGAGPILERAETAA